MFRSPGAEGARPGAGRHLPALSDAAARELIEALDAGFGIVAAVGAGGKKTTLNRLAEAHLRRRTGRLAMVAAVQMVPPLDRLSLTPVIAPADRIEAALDAADPSNNLVLAAPPSKPGRLAGLPPATIARLHTRGRFAVSLVKADGARMRGIKAPAPGEPVLPDGTTTVLALVSADVIGRPLDPTIAHRPERLAALLGLEHGQLLTPHDVGRLLAAPAGALQGTGRARVVPVLNAVEGPDRLECAREAASVALGATDRFDHVVLASMIAARPVVEVVARTQPCL
jgi:probable selenium-dependent hydroxylase accessory protein YqeC